MVQINIKFLFLLNSVATWPHWAHIPAGCVQLAPLHRACAVRLATVPARPDPLVRRTCRAPRASELAAAPGSHHRGAVEELDASHPRPRPPGVGTASLGRCRDQRLLPCTRGPLQRTPGPGRQVWQWGRFVEGKAGSEGTA